MQLQNFYAQDANGNTMPLATGTLYLPGSTTLATGLQDVNGEPLSNPFSADTKGLISIAAPNGYYDLVIDAGTRTGRLRVMFIDVDQVAEDAASASDSAQASEYAAVVAISRTARFLAPSATDPVIRDDGTPLQIGDRYVNTVTQAEYIYKTGGWALNDSLAAIADLENASDPAKGAALLPYDGTTTGEQMLVSRKLASYTSLLAYGGSATRIEITQSKISGSFLRRAFVGGDVEIYGVKFISADGLSVWERDFSGVLQSSWLGASPTATAAVNTQALQAGINFLNSVGGGVLKIGRGKHQVSATSEADLVLADTVFVPIAGCLVLRSGVTLDLTDHATIECTNQVLNVIATIDMDGGGILGGWVKNTFNEGGVMTGTGHGIQFNISNLLKDNINLTFSGVRISNVGSYGLGAQCGDYINNRYENLYLHDTGADAIDHKVRYGSKNISRGVSFDNILIQRHGRRNTLVASSGIDIRGPANLSNIFVIDYAKQGSANVGLRFSAGTGIPREDGYEVREASSHSSLTNFFIDAGDLSVTDSQGLVLLSSEGTAVSNGTILNCGRQAFVAIDSASGWGTCKNSTLTSVTADGAVTEAFSITSERVTLVGCSAVGARTTFEARRNNLAAGQTAFTVTRGYIPATRIVYKNSVALVSGTDYTATDGKLLTLVAPVLVTDSIVVVTPTVTGFYSNNINTTLVACRAQDVTNPKTITGAATGFQEIGSNLGENSIRSVNGSGTPYLEPLTTSTDLDLELRGKGAGSVVMRARGLRALLASNPASAANWLTVVGSVTGSPVQIQAQGSDANIHLSLEPKASGNVRVPPICVPAYANDAAASTGGVPIGGFYRIGNALQIRLA